MTGSEIKHRAYLADKRRAIIQSLKSLSDEQIIAWSDGIFFNTFDTPAQHIERKAKEFEADVLPF